MFLCCVDMESCRGQGARIYPFGPTLAAASDAGAESSRVRICCALLVGCFDLWENVLSIAGLGGSRSRASIAIGVRYRSRSQVPLSYSDIAAAFRVSTIHEMAITPLSATTATTPRAPFPCHSFPSCQPLYQRPVAPQRHVAVAGPLLPPSLDRVFYDPFGFSWPCGDV